MNTNEFMNAQNARTERRVKFTFYTLGEELKKSGLGDFAVLSSCDVTLRTYVAAKPELCLTFNVRATSRNDLYLGNLNATTSDPIAIRSLINTMNYNSRGKARVWSSAHKWELDDVLFYTETEVLAREEIHVLFNRVVAMGSWRKDFQAWEAVGVD